MTDEKFRTCFRISDFRFSFVFRIQQSQLMKRISIIVSGKVHGVFYRANTEKKANEIGLTGYVRNEPDGTVYIEAQGNEKQLNEFVEWCKRGPERARVDGVVTHEIPLTRESSFRVIR